MTTRRIESPRYGMVVSDGVAGRVFMLLCLTYEEATGDELLVWEAMRLNTPDGLSSRCAERARVFLAPGEFAEVVEDEPTAAAGYYPFVGGPANGKSHYTGGLPVHRIAVMPPLSIASYSAEVEDEPVAYSTVDYELRRDGRYHLVGGA